MTVSLENISISYKNSSGFVEPIFKDFSLKINQGEFVCFLGPSGCGKSTLLGLIAGFVKTQSGQVLVKDKPVSRPDINRTLVFQEYGLFPWLNVIDNVCFGLKNIISDKQERYLLAARYLKIVGLLKQARHNVSELSGGMKQRVALARALVVKPDLLLMDEPFAALDAQTRETMRHELIRIWSEINSSNLDCGDLKQSVIFVTHSVDEALTLADRVVVIAKQDDKLADIVADIKIDLARPRLLAASDVNKYRLEITEALTGSKREEGFVYDVGL